MMATATPARPTAPDPYLLGGGFISCVTFGRSRALRWRAVIRHTTGSEGDAMDALRGSRLGGCAPRWTEALLQPGLLAPAPHEGTARMHTL